MPNRNLVVNMRVSEREKSCLEKAAEASGMTLSDYMRAGAMTLAMMDGSTEAAKITAELAKEKFGPQIEKFKMALGIGPARGQRATEG